MKTKRAWIVAAVFLNLPLPAYGDDVYNIYFQKAPGPQNVNQGTTPAEDKAKTSSKGAPQANAPATTPQAPQATTETDPEPLRWRITVGRTDVTQGWGIYNAADDFNYTNHYTALSLGGQYAFSRYFGTDISLVMPDSSKQLSTRVALGLTLTPLHLQLFGREFIDMSLLGGLVTTELRAGSGYVVRPYIGVGFNFHLSDRFSISTQYKSFDGGSHNTVGLTYKF